MHHVVASKPFPVQFRQLFEALTVVENRLAGRSPQSQNGKLYTKAAAKANPERQFGSKGRIGKISIFQPLRRADGSILVKSAALLAAAVADSMLFQARSRMAESPVTTSSAASGTAMRALSGTGPQTIMKKS